MKQRGLNIWLTLMGEAYLAMVLATLVGTWGLGLTLAEMWAIEYFRSGVRLLTLFIPALMGWGVGVSASELNSPLRRGLRFSVQFAGLTAALLWH